MWKRLGELTEQMQQLKEQYVDHNNSRILGLEAVLNSAVERGCEVVSTLELLQLGMQ